MIDDQTMAAILKGQRNEITEYHVYRKLADAAKDPGNKKLLRHIAKDEQRHYGFWKKYSKQDVEPNAWKIFWYTVIIKLFGLTFGVKLMEKGEDLAQKNYRKISKVIPEVATLEAEEKMHEFKLSRMLKEQKLSYVGSIVLGLNDALVELTGALAGLTLAFQKTSLVAIAGLITGIAASLSMAASEYLSTKAEGEVRKPLTAAVYTGIAYIITVVLLVLPFFLASNPYLAFAWTFGHALLIIILFNFYIAIVQEVSFRKRFFEMVFLSLGVAFVTFLIGYFIRTYFNIEI
jgi:vacuolar iron transporter family protein